MSVGVPLKLLHEGIGHAVTVELRTGESYRGHLMNAEDNMNVQLEGVTVTAKDGKTTHFEQVYLRGSQIRFVVLPDTLKHCPMFKQNRGKAGRGLGVGSNKGKATAIQAGAARRKARAEGGGM